MKEKVISILFLLVFGAAFLGVGIFLMREQKHLKEVCITEVQSTVIENKKRTVKRKKHKTSIKYTPVFEYDYNGKTYTFQSSISTNPPRFDEGEKVQIFLNPDDPHEVYVPADGTTRTITYVVLMAVGGIAVIAAPVKAFKK